MFTNRRPYYGLKMSTTDFFREPVRFLKESNTQESMMEKPYLVDEYPKMHLSLPDFKFKPREIPSIFGPIANGDPFPGLATINYGDARCHWDVVRTSACVEGSVVITMVAHHFWRREFEFHIIASGDTSSVAIEKLPDTKACAWDEQDYLLTFPENYNGTISICGSASTHTLISQTFETVVAGMPVGLHVVNGSLVALEKGQGKSITLLKSVYGEKGDSCGCIEISSSCAPACECKNIGYTSRQMDIDEVQTLIVVDPDPDCEYGWFITSGGGSLSPLTGTDTTYTAPSSNDGCGANPTITLTVNGLPCDTLGIAVNAYPNLTHYAFYANGSGCYSAVPEGGQLCGDHVCQLPYCWQCCVNRLACDGSLIDVTYSTSCWDYNPEGCHGSAWCGMFCSDTSNTDVRTEAMIEEGCCPSGLL